MGSGGQERPALQAHGSSTSGVIEAHLSAIFDRVTLVSQSAASLVYRAGQRSTGRTIAVKVFLNKVADDGPVADTEVRAHAAMSWHPNVATLFDAGVTPGGLLWMSLELAPTTLSERLARHALEPVELLCIARQLVSAVAAMHTQSIVHCDLKPSNVLLAVDGSVRLTDFGIAQLLDLSPPTLDATRGTLQYISPEVLEGAHPTTGSDVWGIGVTLWAAIHGRSPFGGDGQTLASIVGAALGGMPEWAPPAGFSGLEAERLREIVELCTNPDPNQRPTAAEVASLVSRPLRAPVGVARPGPVGAGPRRLRGVCALLASVAVVVGAISLRDDSRGAPVLVNATADEWCKAVAQGDAEIGTSLDRAAAQIVAGHHDAVAVRSALRELPVGIDAATASLRRILAVEPRFANLAASLSETRMRDYIVAETATYLATGHFILDPTQPTKPLDPSLPPAIAETAQSFGRVSAQSQALCGSEGISWRQAQIHMIDEVSASIEGPTSPFFSDPHTPLALDADLLSTVIAVQPAYFVHLVVEHPDWLIKVTSDDGGSPAITTLLLGPAVAAFRQIALQSKPVAAYVHGNLYLITRLTESVAGAQQQRQFISQIIDTAGPQ